MWLLGGSITLSKFWVNIVAAKKATARNVSLPTLTRSCFTGVGMAKTLQRNGQKIAQLRARKDAQLRHTSVGAL